MIFILFEQEHINCLNFFFYSLHRYDSVFYKQKGSSIYSHFDDENWTTKVSLKAAWNENIFFKTNKNNKICFTCFNE